MWRTGACHERVLGVVFIMKDQGETGSGSIKMLVVGDVTRWQSRGRLPDPPDGYEFIDLAQLDSQKIRQYDAALIVTPLISDRFDAVDVAEKLASVCFKGMFRVLTNHLPDVDIIRVDIQDVAPCVDFDLLVLPGAGT